MTDLPIDFAGPEPVITDHELSPNRYGPNVRVMCRPASAPSCDLCVEVRDLRSPSGWRTIAKYNDMSDDYAHTKAHSRAIRARADLIDGVQP